MMAIMVSSLHHPALHCESFRLPPPFVCWFADSLVRLCWFGLQAAATVERVSGSVWVSDSDSVCVAAMAAGVEDGVIIITAGGAGGSDMDSDITIAEQTQHTSVTAGCMRMRRPSSDALPRIATVHPLH